jgi:hypothetical protein
VVTVIALLVLAGVANATIKRGRVVDRSAPSAALTVVHLGGAVSSVAWYCAGPFPLGLKHEESSLVLANVTGRSIDGEFSVATASGVLASYPVMVTAKTSKTILLPATKRSAFASATVLVDGGGLAVSEEILGPGGADISPCVNHATQTQYLASGATTRPNTIALSLYDPGATPSVASIAFSTPNGPVSPPAYQGLPIAAGAALILDVGRYLPSQALVGITVTSAGGPVVVGALESSVVAGKTLASMVTADAVAERAWWLAPAPAGTTARQRFTILNPGDVGATVKVATSGDSGLASEVVAVPGRGVISLSTASEAQVGAVRWATVTSSEPIVVTRATTLLGPGGAGGVARAITGAAKVIAGLPVGYTISAATPALARSWLIGDGESDAGQGELILMANPSAEPATVTFSSLSGGVAPATIRIASRGERVVSVPTTRKGTAIVVTATAPVVVDSGNFARGASASIGWSSPGAIVVS